MNVCEAANLGYADLFVDNLENPHPFDDEAQIYLWLLRLS
jgi:hypothetical protein